MKIKILPSALGDIDRGRRFYARRGNEIGEYFLDSLIADIDSLVLYAGAHMKVFGFHRLLARRFPYAVYYRVDGEICIVFRVLDCRQAPGRTALLSAPLSDTKKKRKRRMNQVLTVAAFMCVAGCVSGDETNNVASPPTAHAMALKAALDEAAPQWLSDADVPSVGVAYIEDGRLQWDAVYGEQGPGVPATDQTLYNIASMTKPITAEIVVRLVSQGVIELDEPMSAYWVDPDIADNPWHELLTPEFALRHQTGFTNWRYETDDVLTFKFEPGTATSYSGEGYDYVARFVEKKTETPLETLADELVFSPIGMKETIFTTKDWIAGRLALPKGPDGEFGETQLADTWSAADNVHTTPAQYARFIVDVMNNGGVSPEIASKRYVIVDNVLAQGCPLAPENCPVAVGMGLGWEVFEYQNETVIMHGGKDVGETTIGYFVPDRGVGVVIFTNGANGAKVIAKVSELLYENPQFSAFLNFQAQH